MGKIKSAIITAIVTLAFVVLMLFSVVSCELPGGVNRYNSIASNIHLGSDLSGDAYALLYPEGVISSDEYNMTVSEGGDDAEEYEEKYVSSSGGSFYVERDLLNDYAEDGSADTSDELAAALASFAEDVQKDAEILSERFGDRRLTSYSVSVVDGCAIRVTVPSNFTYAAYAGKDNTSLTEDLSVASYEIYYLTLGGEFTLRNTDSSTGWRDTVSASQSSSGSTVTYNIFSVRANVADYFKSVSYYAAGGSYAIKITLTSEGKEVMSSVSQKVADSDDTYLRFYVGETEILNLTCESAITSSSFYVQVSDADTARNYAALLNSVATGNALSFVYDYDEVIYTSSAAGAETAMFLAIAVLVIIVALMAFAVARYRALGLVFALLAIGFADAMIAVLFLAGTQLTVVGIFTAIMCLALFAGCNFWIYEAVRKESQAGRTMQAAVKVGYKKTFTGILDLHIVLLIISVILSLVCSGEAAACGIVLLIGTLASYLLNWFGRFMWYVTMSPARDKYKFCGFKREAFEEDED